MGRAENLAEDFQRMLKKKNKGEKEREKETD